MVRYRKPTELSRNLEDRRGSPRGRRATAIGAGGGGIAILIAVVFALLGGGGGLESLAPALEQLQGAQQAPIEAEPLPSDVDPDRELVEYMSVVLDDTQVFWDEVFRASGLEYRDATTVLFEGYTDSGCGGADERYGPHYCPLDENVYLDLGFFRELQTRFGARGDFGPAYVLSHEIAHHVQNLLGTNRQVRDLQQSDPSLANELSVRLELQADCFAGVWASSVFELDNSTLELDRADIAEGIEAARAVGDDRIQEAATGRIDPESWTHGSSDQRESWFIRGYETGDPTSCDTFSAEEL
jgi:predicted metalloprotease